MALPRDPGTLRSLFGQSDDKRDAGLTPPDDVTRFCDLRYGEDPLQVLDIYRPAGTAGALPVIVSIHGGGYVYGDKQRYRFYCMSLAQQGFAVVNFSYRLAPVHRFPAQLEDTSAALAFAAAHTDACGLDLSNVFLIGDSAGAQLCSQYAAAVANPDYAALLGLDIPAFTLRAVALNCGMYDRFADDDSPAANWLLGPLAERTDELHRKMDIFSFIDSRYPPAFVMSGTGDFLLKYAAPMADHLKSKGVQAALRLYGDPGGPNEENLGHVFHLNIRSTAAIKCNGDECDFFKNHIAK